MQNKKRKSSLQTHRNRQQKMDECVRMNAKRHTVTESDTSSESSIRLILHKDTATWVDAAHAAQAAHVDWCKNFQIETG